MSLHEVAAMLGYLALLGTTMSAIKFAQRRFHWKAETSRKGAHLALGLASLAVPWLFARALPVVMLAFIVAALLVALRLLPAWKARLGSVLGSIERQSWGEILFPLGVAFTFALARGDTVKYLAAILVLTLADAAAAWAGGRFGPPGVRKSFAGTLAFFLVALGALAVMCPWHPALLAVALAAAGLEFVSVHGLDNLTIPLGVLLLLQWLA